MLVSFARSTLTTVILVASSGIPVDGLLFDCVLLKKLEAYDRPSLPSLN